MELSPDQSSSQTPPASKTSIWIGRILSGLAVLVFVITGLFGLMNPALAAQGAARYGYPDGTMSRIFIVEVACVILYAIPRTSVLGAILLTGYLGGATSTHVRASEPFYLPLAVGIVIWLGLFFRDDRLRALIPLRTPRPVR